MLLTLARLIAAALLIASAAAFAAGAAIERHTVTSEVRRTPQHAETGAPGENHASPEGTSRESSAGSRSEDLLGINPESTGLVLVAVALSLLLAALILTVRSPLIAAGVALAMLAFTALDIREVAHQLNESRSGRAALAAAIALLHVLAGVAALRTARDSRRASGSISTSPSACLTRSMSLA
jgi:hypothetical protein